MALPVKTDAENVTTYFDCKIRRLFVHIPKQEIKEEAPAEQADEEVNLNTDIVEEPANDDDDIEVIDTDDHFGREKSGKVQKPPKEEPKLVNSNDLDDDLLYDLC